MSDLIQIKIDNLRLFAYHGATKEEKKEGQTFKINVNYYLKNIDFKDELNNTIDYRNLVDEIKGFFTTNRYNLIEQLVKDLTNNIFIKFTEIIEILRLAKL